MRKVIRRVILWISALLLLISLGLAVAYQIFGGLAPDGMEYGFWMQGSAAFAFVGAVIFGILFLIISGYPPHPKPQEKNRPSSDQSGN